MKVEICRLIIMCLSAFLWSGCGYMLNSKDDNNAEIIATLLMAFMFDFWATFGNWN